MSRIVEPFGRLDTLGSPAPGQIRVRGWAADPSDPDGPITVHVLVNGRCVGSTTAHKYRPEVARANPGFGQHLGYDTTLAVADTGQVEVCTYAVTTGRASALLGSRTTTVAD